MAKGSGEKKINRAQDVITREYTIHLRKLLHGSGDKKRPPRAAKARRALAPRWPHAPFARGYARWRSLTPQWPSVPL